MNVDKSFNDRFYDAEVSTNCFNVPGNPRLFCVNATYACSRKSNRMRILPKMFAVILHRLKEGMPHCLASPHLTPHPPPPPNLFRYAQRASYAPAVHTYTICIHSNSQPVCCLLPDLTAVPCLSPPPPNLCRLLPLPTFVIRQK